MGTPLARRLKPISRKVIESPARFKLNQLLRLFDRAGVPVRTVVDPSPICRMGEVVSVRPARRKQPAELTVTSSALPLAICSGGAEAVEEYIRTRHAAWVMGHPALATEVTKGADKTTFARQLHALANVPGSGVPEEFLAHAAGAFRRGNSHDLEAACSEYFGVPIRLEPESGARARIRVGPLTFAEFLEFLPSVGGLALTDLHALAGAFLSEMPPPDVLLIVRADEVPRCMPNTAGATVGVACWPHTGGRTRRDDAEYLISGDTFEQEQS